MMRTRLQVTCAHKPIFHACPIKTTPMTIKEVDEHLIACKHMSTSNARDYMYSVNLDHDTTKCYLLTVKYLESCWNKSSYR